MFKFLKRLRDKKTSVAAPESVIDTAAESPPPESKPTLGTRLKVDAPAESIQVEKDRVSAAPIQSKRQPAEPSNREPESSFAPFTQGVDVEEVELPKRSLGDGIRSLFKSQIELDNLEDILLQADFGIEAAEEITTELRSRASKGGLGSDAELRLALRDILVTKLERPDIQLNLSDGKLPYVFLVVGVNGAGKTTTIGKLSKWLFDGEWSVTLGAADTYRAAAVDQLQTWAERSNSRIVRPEREGQDPASVAYQTVEKAISEDADIAIVDTAGRLQNKRDLMDELGKIRRAVEKQAQVNEVLLVIDATTGQNAINQARAFTEVADVTGIVMTKLDGTAKGGIVYQIQKELDLPVKLVGVGEGVNDFAFFSAEEFANGLVARRD